MRSLKELMIATQEFTVEDPKKSWGHLLIGLFTLAVFITGAAMNLPAPVRILFSVLEGLTIVRLFIMYHDYLHGAILRKSKIAKYFMRFYGVMILNPSSIWERSHNYHHQHNAQIATASIGSFPVMTTKQYAEASAGERFLYRMARHPLTIAVGYVTIFIIGMCLKSFLTDPKRHWDSLLALVVHFALMTALVMVGGWSLAFFVLILPMVIGCALGAYLFYIQHNFPDAKMVPRAEWDYLFAALYSSSYMQGNGLVHWFTGNIGYHHVHHLNARIPFYRLPEAMAAIPELQNPGRTSLGLRDVITCFRLKLWDPDQKRMVGFS